MPQGIDPSQRHTRSETIELGGFQLVDELNAPLVAAISSAARTHHQIPINRRSWHEIFWALPTS
jgi:hypothetical protein